MLPSIEENLVKAKRGLAHVCSEDSYHSRGSKFKEVYFHAKKLDRLRPFQKLEMVAKSSNDLALFDILWQVSKSNFSF